MPPKATRSWKRKGSSQLAVGSSKRATRSATKISIASTTVQEVAPPATPISADLIERTPAQVATGSVNVDVGALMAMITAAISQGLCDAGVVPSLTAQAGDAAPLIQHDNNKQQQQTLFYPTGY